MGMGGGERENAGGRSLLCAWRSTADLRRLKDNLREIRRMRREHMLTERIWNAMKRANCAKEMAKEREIERKRRGREQGRIRCVWLSSRIKDGRRRGKEKRGRLSLSLCLHVQRAKTEGSRHHVSTQTLLVCVSVCVMQLWGKSEWEACYVAGAGHFTPVGPL